MSERPSVRDFRGPQVVIGLLMGLGGFLADQWPTPFRMGPVMFFGGLMVGVGVMRSFVGRTAQAARGGAAADGPSRRR